MDALTQLAPVAAPLLRDVDAALLTLGAPPAHPVLRALGRVGTTPSELVAYVADLEPSRLHGAASALRDQATAYEQASIPVDPGAEGETARHYTAAAVAARDHLAGDVGSLVIRLRAQASYAESLADWQQALRDRLARALAEVMNCGQAVTLRSHTARAADVAGLSGAVVAAADIATVLLGVAEDAAGAGRDVVHAAAGELEELPYRAGDSSEPVVDSRTIRLE